MPQAFVSLDGKDARGVRAEVWVQTGRGKVVRIDEKDKTASVSVRGEGLRHDSHGWISKEDPLYAEIQKAYDQRKDVDYRIESQRKKTVDRSIGIKELRSDKDGKPSMDVARENIVQIFAGLNGELSREAVTHPSEDQSGDRHRATGDESRETPANGSAVVAAEVSRISTIVDLEVAVRNHLREAKIYDLGILGAESARYTGLVLSAVEKVTAAREGETFALIAKVAMDSVDKYLPISVNDESNDDAWLSSLVELTTARFRLISSLTNGSVPTTASSVSSSAPSVSLSTPVTEPVSAPVPDAAPEPEPAPEYSAASSGVNNGDDTDSLEIFTEVQDNSLGARADGETVQQLRNFVTECEIPREDLGLLTNLLRQTFGVAKASEVSEVNLGNFIDFYAASGEENFVKVLNHVNRTGSLSN